MEAKNIIKKKRLSLGLKWFFFPTTIYTTITFKVFIEFRGHFLFLKMAEKDV